MPIDPSEVIFEIEDRVKKLLHQPTKELLQFIEYVQNKLPELKDPFLFAHKVFLDNSLRELIGGRLRVSEKTLNELVRQALSEREEIKSLALFLHDGYIDGKGDIIVKNNPIKVAFRVDEIKLVLSPEVKEILFVLAEAPAVEMKNSFKNVFAKLAWSVIRSLHGEGRINEILLKDLEGVSVAGNEISLDLKKMPALKQVAEAEILGVNILDLIRVEKVEMKEGELLIYGALKAPE